MSSSPYVTVLRDRNFAVVLDSNDDYLFIAGGLLVEDTVIKEKEFIAKYFPVIKELCANYKASLALLEYLNELEDGK